MNEKPRGMVHYRLLNGECRPFLITKAWNEAIVNGTLFIDGANDYKDVPQFIAPNPPYSKEPTLTIWRTSVPFNGSNGFSHTWHYPEEA